MLRPAFLTRTGFGRRPPVLGRGLAAWLPESVVGPGKKPGFVYKSQAPGKIKQNADGTGDVVNPGDPIGFVEDTSGNGHHATQTDPAKRPTWTSAGYIDFASGQSLEVTFDPIASATTGWAYLDGSSVTAADLSSGTLTITDDFYALVVTDDSLTVDEQDDLDAWLTEQVTTSVFQAATNLRAVFIPD